MKSARDASQRWTLKDIAQRFASDPELQLFAEYCRLKGFGLRRQALLVIDEFIAQIEGDPSLSSRFEVVHRLYEIENEAGIHNLLPHPLITKVMRPTCEAMVLKDDQDPRPYRWLGFQDNWRKALELDPSDSIARGRWSSACWRDLDYALHELPVGVLSSVSEIAEIVLILDQHCKRSGGITDWPESWLRRLATSYLDYARSGERVPFQQWAARHGRPSSVSD